MNFDSFGAVLFGLVVGYITYRTLVRTADKTSVSDLAAVVSAIGGGVVVNLYDTANGLFSWYAIGLAVGMALFYALYWAMNGKGAIAKVMGRSGGPQS